MRSGPQTGKPLLNIIARAAPGRVHYATLFAALRSGAFDQECKFVKHVTD